MNTRSFLSFQALFATLTICGLCYGCRGFMGSGHSTNYALEFDGESTFLEIPPSKQQKPQSLTVEMNVWLDDTQGNSIPFICEANANQGNKADGFSVKFENGYIHWRLATARNLAHSFATRFAFHPGRWYHIACTFDGSTGIIYVDGILVHADRADFPIYYGSYGVRFGHALNYARGGEFFLRGKMDEIRIWGRVRTQSEILETMNTPLSGDEPGLVGYWNFDPASEGYDVGRDSSPVGNHGKVSGSPRVVRSTAFD